MGLFWSGERRASSEHLLCRRLRAPPAGASGLSRAAKQRRPREGQPLSALGKSAGESGQLAEARRPPTWKSESDNLGHMLRAIPDLRFQIPVGGSRLLAIGEGSPGLRNGGASLLRWPLRPSGAAASRPPRAGERSEVGSQVEPKLCEGHSGETDGRRTAAAAEYATRAPLGGCSAFRECACALPLFCAARAVLQAAPARVFAVSAALAAIKTGQAVPAASRQPPPASRRRLLQASAGSRLFSALRERSAASCLDERKRVNLCLCVAQREASLCEDRCQR